MEPQRYLCLRFPNWPIQAHQLRARTQSPNATHNPNNNPNNNTNKNDINDNFAQEPIALHTPLPNTPAALQPIEPDSAKDLLLLKSIFPAAKSGPAIIAVNKAAWNLGVRPGLPLAEARSLATPIAPQNQPATRKKLNTQPVQFIPWLPAPDRTELIALSDQLRRFAPIVGLDSLPLPDSLLLNVTGCAPLFGGELGLLNELVNSLQQSQLRPRAAIADSIAAAWAVAHNDQTYTGTFTILPHNCGTQPLESLPVAAARLSPNDLDILQHLGIHRIAQLLKLPIEELPARLSAECVLRIRQLRGDIPEHITPLPEISPVNATWAGDDPAVGLQDLQWILTKLCENLAPQLENKRLACHALNCEFLTPDRRSLSLYAGLVKPERSSTLLADVLSLRLEFLVTQALRKIAPKLSGLTPTQPRQPQNTPQLPPLPPNDNPEQPAPTHPLDFADLATTPIAAVRLTAVSGPPAASRQRKLFATMINNTPTPPNPSPHSSADSPEDSAPKQSSPQPHKMTPAPNSALAQPQSSQTPINPTHPDFRTSSNNSQIPHPTHPTPNSPTHHPRDPSNYSPNHSKLRSTGKTPRPHRPTHPTAPLCTSPENAGPSKTGSAPNASKPHGGQITNATAITTTQPPPQAPASGSSETSLPHAGFSMASATDGTSATKLSQIFTVSQNRCGQLR